MEFLELVLIFITGVSEWDIRPKFSFLLFLDFRSEGILVKVPKPNPMWE